MLPTVRRKGRRVMGDWRKISLNDKIEVVLNEPGAKILNDRNEKMRSLLPRWQWPTYAAGQIYETEIWDFANIFGHAMHQGANPAPIQMNARIKKTY